MGAHSPHVEDQDQVDRVIAERVGRPGALLGILGTLQSMDRQRHLPLETLEYVAARTGIPQAQVYGVASFFALFNLDPQGVHTVAICRGTACHTRGSRPLLDRLRLQLRLDESEDDGERKVAVTTPDGQFTVRTVACFGQCALAPVVEIDHAIRGHVSEQSLIREVETLRKAGAR